MRQDPSDCVIRIEPVETVNDEAITTTGTKNEPRRVNHEEHQGHEGMQKNVVLFVPSWFNVLV
jgi:hypothetical protein